MAVRSTRARAKILRARLPGLTLTLHAAPTGERRPAPRTLPRGHRRRRHHRRTMLFMEEHIKASARLLERRETLRRDDLLHVRRRNHEADAMGRFAWTPKQKGPLAILLKRAARQDRQEAAGSRRRQMAMLRQLPKILRFIPARRRICAPTS
jgi:magnesium chelatase subunit H